MDALLTHLATEETIDDWMACLGGMADDVAKLIVAFIWIPMMLIGVWKWLSGIPL